MLAISKPRQQKARNAEAYLAHEIPSDVAGGLLQLTRLLRHGVDRAGDDRLETLQVTAPVGGPISWTLSPGADRPNTERSLSMLAKPTIADHQGPEVFPSAVYPRGDKRDCWGGLPELRRAPIKQ